MEVCKECTGECTMCGGTFLLSAMFYGDVCLSCQIKKHEQQTKK